MGGGAWRATVHGVTELDTTELFHFHFHFSFYLDIYPEVGLLDHMLALFLVFLGTSLLFSIVAAPV